VFEYGLALEAKCGTAAVVEALLTCIAAHRHASFADDAGRELSSRISNITSPRLLPQYRSIAIA
jgi:hypothetical protein